jgi:hypothetical protein
MDQASESGLLSLRYPVFAVLSAEPAGEEYLTVVEVDGHDCLLLFRTRELGELYAEQPREAGAKLHLTLRPCHEDAELAHLLEQLPGSVSHVVWDATPRAQALRVTSVSDLLAVIRPDGE